MYAKNFFRNDVFYDLMQRLCEPGCFRSLEYLVIPDWSPDDEQLAYLLEHAHLLPKKAHILSAPSPDVAEIMKRKNAPDAAKNAEWWADRGFTVKS